MRIKKLKKAISMLMAVTMTASGVMSFFPSYSYAESETETVAETEMTTESTTEAVTETVEAESEVAETVTTDDEAAETEKKAAKSSSEAADSNEEDTENSSTDPVDYELLLPYYADCTYTYNSEKLKEAKADGSLVLSYEAGEQVAFSLTYPEGASLDEIHVYDSSNAGCDFSWDEVDQTMSISFVMPAADTRLELAFSEITEESDLGTETEEAYNFIAFEVSEGGQMVIGFSDGTSETVTSDMLSDDWDYEINFPVSEEVTISGTANDGYVLDSVVVTNENGETIATSDVLPITVVANADYKITVRLNFVAVDAETVEESGTESETENVQDGSESESGTDGDNSAEFETDMEDSDSNIESETADNESNAEVETDADTENPDEAETESGDETELESESAAEVESEADSENENEETSNDSEEDDEFTTDSVYYLSDDEMLSYIRPEAGVTIVLSAQYVY
ncbi:MAG: hypothetical protein LUI14_11345 [Lachnospiraceae bacterium]|nr:hypothetical protein [Lachnospiraceae bacterium]